jgi:MFS family permease
VTTVDRDPDSAGRSPLPVTGSVTTAAVYDRVFWLAYLANTLLVLANALTFRFAELVSFLGGTEQLAGDVVAIGLCISVLLRMSLSHVIDDYGTRRMWSICTGLFILGGVLFVCCHQLDWTIYAARVTFVVGLTGMFACSVTHIQNHVPPIRRTEVIGNLGSSGFIGMILGSLLGDWILRVIPAGRTQFMVLFGCATLIGLVYLGLVFAVTAGQRHVRPHRTIPAARLLVRHWPGAVVVVAMIMGLGVTVTTVFLTRFATRQSIEGIATFFTGYALSAFVFRMLVMRWSHSIGRHWMLVRGLIGHSVGHALLAFVTEGWQLVLPSIVCGFGHALLFPAVVSLGSGAFPNAVRGAGTAIILAFVDFGSLIFSPLMGRIIVSFGFQTMFCVSSLLALTLAVLYSLIAWRYPDTDLAHPTDPTAQPQ